MLKLLRGGEVYAPQAMGRKDVLVFGEKVVKIDDRIDAPSGFLPVEEIDVSGRFVVPGFIDYHNHMLGGGGGNGYASRVPPMRLSQFTRAGITTAVGALGFDNHTRDLDGLLGLAKSLEEEGLTTYIFSGGTATHPILTFTGNIGRDMVLIDKVVGPGEVSISEMGPSLDSMGPGTEHIAKVAADAFLAARLTRKSGLVCLQIPSQGRYIEPVFEIVQKTGIPASQFVPSHSNSSEKYMLQAFDFAKLGGWCDFNSSYAPPLPHERAIKASKAVKRALEADVPLDRITMSTDGNGGHPLYDEAGNPTGTNYFSVSTLHRQFCDIVQQEKLPLADALQIVTLNVARALRLSDRKGRVAEGADADLLVLNRDLEIDQVYARGKQMLRDGEPVVKGLWEDMLAGKP